MRLLSKILRFKASIDLPFLISSFCCLVNFFPLPLPSPSLSVTKREFNSGFSASKMLISTLSSRFFKILPPTDLGLLNSLSELIKFRSSSLSCSRNCTWYSLLKLNWKNWECVRITQSKSPVFILAVKSFLSSLLLSPLLIKTLARG